ncbi:MAG: YhfC family intramembrane metalloprotease [Lachnospiraceae bacterium]|nr:YhfC family intramembrane metalloprotease [Lachnospiraceae bacterium]
MHIQIYIVSFLEVVFPLLALVLLSRLHKYRFSAVIGGIAAYYLAADILMVLVTMLLSVMGMDETFWEEHLVASSVTNVVLNALFHDLTLYLVLRFTLKNRGRIYDAMALGISYWLFSSIMNSIMNGYYARIYQMAQAGRLSEMVNDSVTLEQLQLTLQDITNAGTLNYYSQLVAIIAMSAVSAACCLFFYLSIKRQDLKTLLLTVAIHLGAMLLVNIPLFLDNSVFYLITNVLALIAGSVVIWRFMLWYREKQKALAYRKKNYQADLKSSSET